MREDEGVTIARFVGSLYLTAVMGFIAACVIALGMALAAVANAQGYPHSPAGQHDQYGDIRNRAGQLCCNRNDCKKIVKEEEVRILPEGGYTVKTSGEHVTEEKVADSPDEHWHICREYTTGPGGYEPKGKVRCLMIPQGGM
jgi:hypothetical protein